MLRKAGLCLLGCCLVAGCAGPNRVSRGLDLRLNQLYVDSPTLAEVLLPVTVVGQSLAYSADLCFVNPWYFWSDVRVGRGTAYFYEDPVTPENVDPNDFPSVPEDPAPPSRPLDPGEPPPANVTETQQEATPAPRGPVPYTVQSGDTLASISRRYYGKPHHWKKIYMANQGVLTSADALRQARSLPFLPRRDRFALPRGVATCWSPLPTG